MINLQTLFDYKVWANGIALAQMEAISEEELHRNRGAMYGSILGTMNHVWVVEDIFRHHLQGIAHGYTARINDRHWPLADLISRCAEMDDWYRRIMTGWSETAWKEPIHFTFVGGGDGVMTRQEIILHLVNHATYHRGFISMMLSQIPHRMVANDLTVYLRDHRPAVTPPTA